MSTEVADLSVEDKKLVTLARATRARVGAAEGAAVRDSDGRTYAGASVDLDSLKLSAIQVCVAMAFASGSQGLEAAVLLADADTDADTEADAVGEADLACLREFGGDAVTVHLGDPRGTVRATTTA